MNSRSARRKKTKRIFYRIHGYKKKLIKIQNPESGNQEEPSGYANADQDANVNKDNAPVNPGCHSLYQMSSKSARRKKAKRIFYRTHGYKKKLIKIQNPESGNQEEPSGYANADQDADVNKDNAPVNPGCHSLDQMSSKSARRKKAKRIFYRTHGYKKLIKIQNPESGNQEEPSGYANADEDADVNKDNAPVNPDNQSVKKDEPVVQA